MVRFDGAIANAHTSGAGSFSFAIQNNSGGFGGRITYMHNNTMSNQQIILNDEVSVSRLTISLLDIDLHQLKTI